nr:hypothetical protein [Tanacetum cinerariifolium]
QNDGKQNQIGNGNLVAVRAEGNAAGHNENHIRCYNCRGLGHFARGCTVRPRRRDAAYLQTQLLIAQKEEARIQLQAEEYDLMAAAADLDEIEELLIARKEEAGIQLQAKEYDLMAAAADLDEIEEVNSNCILMANLQQESTSDFSDDTTPSVARKFLNEVKSTISTLQRVVKQRMTIETHNWASSAHQELHKIVRDEFFPIVNQVDARLQNFKIQFLKEAAKFVGDFKSLAKEDDASLAKHKALELEIERLLKAVDTSKNTKFAKQPIVENLPKVGKPNALPNPVTSNSVSTPQESKGVNNDKVIAPGMFRINHSKTSREEEQVPNTVRASAKTKPITVSQLHVITRKDVNSNLNGLSFTGVDNTKIRRP